MKDLSFFLLKNFSLGAKMKKKGMRNFCNTDGSTSTLNQHRPSSSVPPSDDHPCCIITSPAAAEAETPQTLEEMILQLEIEEEETARRNKLNEEMLRRGRLSCVNNSDILRSARNALNQYPRFSLDGKDAMYRSSFRNCRDSVGHVNGNGRRKSVCCDHGIKERMDRNCRSHYSMRDPSILGGERVVWCKPGVVAKLMGLEAIPVPISGRGRREMWMGSVAKRQNLRRRAERHEMERMVGTEMSNVPDGFKRGMRMGCSSKSNGYCVMKPVAVESEIHDAGGWPIRRFRY